MSLDAVKRVMEVEKQASQQREEGEREARRRITAAEKAGAERLESACRAAEIKVKKMMTEEEEKNAKLICTEMHGFDEVRKELWIQFATKEEFEAKQQTLFDAIADMDGEDNIVVYISAIKAMKRMPANWNISINEGAMEKISQIFGRQNVKVVEKNVEFQRKRY